jgi:hypothetical protein
MNSKKLRRERVGELLPFFQRSAEVVGEVLSGNTYKKGAGRSR